MLSILLVRAWAAPHRLEATITSKLINERVPSFWNEERDDTTFLTGDRALVTRFSSIMFLLSDILF